MFARNVIIALLSLMAISVNAVMTPRATNAPCEFTCPPKDKVNHDLQSFNNGDGATIVCNYQPDGRNCHYGRYTGELRPNGNSNPDCPSIANNPNGCTPAKRRGLEDRKRAFEARAAKPRAVLTPEVKGIIERRRNLRITKGINKRDGDEGKAFV